jgi:hypothetical protein
MNRRNLEQKSEEMWGRRGERMGKSCLKDLLRKIKLGK